MTLVDTSVLVRFLDPDPSFRGKARAAIAQRLADGVPLCVCAQCLIEFWAVATRPQSANGLGMSLEVALSEVEGFEQMLTLLPEPDDIFVRWKRLVVEIGVHGKAVHDSRIVALMESHGVERILTLNPGDFSRYPGIQVEAL